MKKMRKRNYIYLLFVMFLITLLVTIEVKSLGNYEIATKQQFVDYLLSDNADMEGSYILYNDLDFTTGSVTYKDVKYDLDQNGLIISPIGEKKNEQGIIIDSYHNPFKGTFNGDGHIIRGLNIRSEADDNEYVGLFGYNQGIISNLGLVDSTVNGGFYVGGITGYNIGTILGCYNTSSIVGIGTVGGITGINYGYIRNCYNTGYVGGATKIGGIVGHNSSVITAVYDLGIISGEVSEDGTKEYGYIFGYNNNQGVIGYVEDENGIYSFGNNPQTYSLAGAYYCSEYDLGVGYNLGYVEDSNTKYDNVNTVAKTLEELKNITNYDLGFRTANSNIHPIGSTYTHKTTGFFIKAQTDTYKYPFPVVGMSEYTSKYHVENTLHTNGFTGSGTVYDPYIIKDALGLNNVRHSLTSAYKLANNINLVEEFVPIGDEINSFRGIFNGNGKRISGFNISSEISKDFIGLFAFNSGIIHNVSVDVLLDVPNSSKVGGIAGFNSGLISECYVKGSILGSNTVGGIAGANELGTIKNCYNLASISGGMDIGGISGYNSGKIELVYSAVVPSYVDINTGKHLGGIVGYCEDSDDNGVVINALHIAGYQIGYLSSTGMPYNAPESKYTSKSAFGVIDNFSTDFNISTIPSGSVPSTIWVIEPGVNGGLAYLANAMPIRINSLAMNPEKELIVDDKIIRVFDESGNLILGSDPTSYGVSFDLNEFLLINPDDAENKKVTWSVVEHRPNTGTSNVVTISGSVITGLVGGSSTIRVTSEDGSKTLDVNVLVVQRVADVYLVNKPGGSHQTPEDLLPETQELENYSSISLYTDVQPSEANDTRVIWSSSDEDIATVGADGLVTVKYLGSPDNPVVNNSYTNPVTVTIRATSIDNNSKFDEITFIITPSSKKVLEEDIIVKEKGIVIPLAKDGNNYTFLNSNQLVNYDTDYLDLIFTTKYNQTYTITSSHANELDPLVDGKKVYISKGFISENTYTNRENTITIIITAENGDQETYTLKVTKALSKVNEIENLNASYRLSVDENNYVSTISTYANNKFTITTKIPYGAWRLYFSPTLLDTTSNYSKSVTHKISYTLNAEGGPIYYDAINLPKKSGTTTIYMRVTAEDGSTRDYQIEYIMEYSDINTLDNIFVGVSGGENYLEFNSNVKTYNINFDFHFPSNIFLQATPTNDDSSEQISRVFISYDGISEPYETNSIMLNNISAGSTLTVQVKVLSEYNNQKGINDYNVYTIYITRELNSDCDLESLIINDDNIPIINNVYDYTYTISGDPINDSIQSALFNLEVSTNANVEVTNLSFTKYYTLETTEYNFIINENNGYYPINIGEAGTYKIKIKVIAQNNQNSKTYYLNVIREPSNNSHFSEIVVKANGVPLTETPFNPLNINHFTYDSNANTYTIKQPINVQYETTNITIEGIVYRYAKYELENRTTIYRSGNPIPVNLNTGFNEFIIKVTAENSSLYTTYVIQVNREKNNSNTLQSLQLLNTSIPADNYINNFDKDTLIYQVGNIGYLNNQLILNFNPSTPLTGGLEAQVNVSISGGIATLEKVSNKSYRINGITDWDANYVITITVIPEDGSISKDYIVTFTRNMSTDTKLKDLKLSTQYDSDTTNIIEDFISGNRIYNLSPLANHQTTLYLSAIPNVSVAKVGWKYANDEISSIVYVDKYELFAINNIPSGENDIEIYVQAQNGSIGSYVIKYERAKSTDNTLKSLNVKDSTNKYYIGASANNPVLVFLKENLNYALTFPYSLSSIELSAQANHESASVTYSIDGINYSSLLGSVIVPLGWSNDDSNKDIIIKVSGEAGNVQEYRISYIRNKDTRTEIERVVSPIADFTYANNQFSSTVNFEISVIDLEVKLLSEVSSLQFSFDNINWNLKNPTIVGGTSYEFNSINLDYGKNKVIYLRVYSQSGEYSTYTVNIYRETTYHQISTNFGPNGTVSPINPQGISRDTVVTVKIIPNANYHIISIKVDGLELITGVENNQPIYQDSHIIFEDGKYYYQFDPITSDHIIEIDFSINQYDFTLIGDGITYSDGLIVYHGTNKTFTFTPNTNYHIEKLLINGVNVISVNNNVPVEIPGVFVHEIDNVYSYTFDNVTQNTSIEVIYGIDKFNIQFLSNGKAVITDGSTIIVDQTNPNNLITEINSGTNKSFVIQILEGYHIKSFIINGEEVVTSIVDNIPILKSDYGISGSGSVYNYSIDKVDNDYIIEIVFELNQYNVHFSTPANGTIENAVSGVITYNHGTKVVLKIAPNIGYHIDKIKLNDQEIVITEDMKTYQEFLPDGYYLYNLTESLDSSYVVEVIFAKNTYTVTFKINGKFNELNEYVDLGDIEGVYYGVEELDLGSVYKNMTYGSLLGSPSLVNIPAGYKANWNYSSDYKVTSNITVYAIYTHENTVSLTFKINGEEVKKVTNQVENEGDYTTFSVSNYYTAPVKNGYNFTWTINSVPFDNTIPYTCNEDVEVIGTYTPIQYTITYMLNGGTNHLSNPEFYNVESNTINLQNPTKLGYTFNGWYDNSGFSGNPVVSIPKGSTSNLTLYAQWIANSNTPYKVEHYEQDLSGHYTLFETDNLTGTTDTIVNAIPKVYQGFTFNSEVSGTLISGNVNADGTLILKLYYQRNSYDLSIASQDLSMGSISGDSGNIKYDRSVTVSATTNPGYTFLGWYDGETKVSSNLIYTFNMPAETLSLMAKFSINTYTITYVLNNGNNDVNNPNNYTVIDLPITLKPATRVGYTFNGWYDNSEFSGEPVVNISNGSTSNLTLYAQWIINKYDISFESNGGTTVDPYQVNYYDPLTMPSVTKNGYILLGWYTDSDFTSSWDFENDRVSEDVTLYASWQIIEYTITYHMDGGINNEANPTTYTIETDTILLNDANKAGHTFIGWYDNSNFAGDIITHIPISSTGNLNLYAKYEIHTFEIEIIILGKGTVIPNVGSIINNILTVDYGTFVELTFAPGTDQYLSKLLIDGVVGELEDIYQFDFVDQNHSIEVQFMGTEPSVLTLIAGSGYGNKVYSIDRSSEEALFMDYYINQSAESIRLCFENSHDRIKFFNLKGTEISDDQRLGTGYIIRLYSDNTCIEVIDEVFVVLKGDINGDGFITTIDVNLINRQVKLLSNLNPIQLVAANITGERVLTTISVNLVNRHLKLLTPLYK